MDNWDLQAVVGGSTNNIGVCISDMENPPFSAFDPWSFQQENDLMSFPQNFDANPKVLDELEELYKPFYPELNQVSTQTIINSSLPVPQDVDEAEDNIKGRQSPVSETVVSGTNKEIHTAAVNKPKRSSRKNQQNRVVQHVTVDDLSSDVWAWRKYGQKPIKGSPYPRSYYRCSSSKGCLARKQVERSCSDPRTLIITYTAEHSHSHPTRRSSLAGSTRSKPTSSSKSLAKNINESQQAAATILSPIKKIKDECKQQELMSTKMEEQMVEEVYQGDGIDLPPTLSDELLPNLESFEGLSVDQFPNLSHELWSMIESANFEQELAELVLDLAS